MLSDLYLGLGHEPQCIENIEPPLALLGRRGGVLTLSLRRLGCSI